MDCELFKDVRPFQGLNFDISNSISDYFYEKYRKYTLEYMYENKPLNEVIKNISDITRYYYLSINPNDSISGLIIFILFIIVSIFMFSSLIFLYINKYKKSFKFLPKDFWFILIFGSFIFMCTILTLYGKPTNLKCHLRIAFITYGNIFNFVPILYKFIINFPVENCFSKWVNKHRYYFLLIFVLIITIFNILIINTSYDIITISILDIEKFQKCKMKNLFGKTIIQFTIIFEFIIIIWTMFLIFLEWNIKETYYDTRLLILVTFTDTLSLLIYCIINEINIENYIAYNIMLICDLFIFSISNYIFLYIFRIFIVLMNNDQDENAIGSFIKKNNEMGIFISDSDSPNRLNTSLSSDLNSSMEIFIIKEGNKGSKFTSRILDFHSREDLN